jgi:diadenosine tetraphosphate (Ap4A) HIT family hydrolase
MKVPTNLLVAASSSLIQLRSSPTTTVVMSITSTRADAAANAGGGGGGAQFGRFHIPEGTIFYRSPTTIILAGAAAVSETAAAATTPVTSIAFVNLRPIVPGHVLVIPQRVVATLQEMTDEEYTDLWLTVRTVQQILRAAKFCGTNADTATAASTGETNPQLSFNVSVQDGSLFDLAVLNQKALVLRYLCTEAFVRIVKRGRSQLT